MSAEHSKIKKNLGIGYIIASTFFLFNPDIAIIDVIPDVFGYLLMIAGLTQFAEINEKIADARRFFQKAAICNAIKFGLIVVLFGMVTPREFPVSMLLFTFVMNLFDLIYVIPAYLNLFGGLLYLGERLDGTFVLGRKKYIPREFPAFADEKHRSAFERREQKRRLICERALSNTEKFRRTTVFFVLFKAVTPVLPEFTSLLNYEYSDSLINYYDFIFLYRTIAVIIMFILGGIWLVKALRYYMGIRKDKAFICALKDKYAAEILPDRVYFMKKFAFYARTIFICAAFFCVNVYFDEYNILPNIISAALFGAAALYVRRYTSKWKFTFAGAVIMGVGSLALEISRAAFNANFIREQIMRNPVVYSAWEKMFVLSLAEAVGVIFTVISSLLIARDIVKKYTGYFMRGTDAFDPERATRELHFELCRPLVITGIFGVLAAACVPFYFFAMPIRFEAVWFFDLVFSMIFSFSFMQNLLDITRHINYGHFLGSE